MFGLLDLAGNHLGASALTVAGAGYVVWKYRRLQAWASLIIGAVSTAGFVGGTLVVGGLIAVGAGWLDPGAMISDLIGWGSTVWNVVGDSVVDAIKGVLPS